MPVAERVNIKSRRSFATGTIKLWSPGQSTEARNIAVNSISR